MRESCKSIECASFFFFFENYFDMLLSRSLKTRFLTEKYRMHVSLYLLIAQAMRSRAFKLAFVIVLTIPLGVVTSSFKPGSCYDPIKGYCSFDDDSSLSTCSCGVLCLQSLAGLLEENVCCEDFQEM